MSEGRRVDPFAATVLGVAALCGVALVAWVVAGIVRSGAFEPAPKPAAEPAAKAAPKPDPRPTPTPASKPDAPPPAAKPAPTATQEAVDPAPGVAGIAPPNSGGSGGVAAPAGTRGFVLAADRTWTYAVRVEPETWRDAVLVYRTVREPSGLAVQTEFRHSKGQMSFRLGTYAAGHPSHAQVRFPGFFMHGAYLDLPLAKGRRMEWTTPWQAADNRVREGRVRRWRAVVGDTEKVSVPAGRFDAVRIDATLTYEDARQVAATVSETIWVVPSANQIVKVIRSGRSPDESAERIVADLAEAK